MPELAAHRPGIPFGKCTREAMERDRHRRARSTRFACAGFITQSVHFTLKRSSVRRACEARYRRSAHMVRSLL